VPYEYVRWWIPAPGEDESIRSIVGRAAHRYRYIGSYGDRLVAHPSAPRERIPSLEGCGAEDILALADRLSIRSRELFAHRQVDSPDLIIETMRAAYCPRCWAQADRQGLPRTFRRTCQSIFALSCPVHPTVPLRQAMIQARDSSPSEKEMPSKLTPRARRFLTWVDGFTATLAVCLFKGAAWPTHWCGDPNAAKVLLSACVTNLTDCRGYALIHNAMVPLHLFSWVRRPAGRLEPLAGDPWTAVRELADPEVRRLAFWLMGWLTVSDMPIDLWPDGFAGRMAYSSICTFRERPLPTRYARAATAILDQAVTRRERQRLALEEGGAIEWGESASAWKEPLRPRTPK
jgi:hypothetical protein